jgi:hypothetical protein
MKHSWLGIVANNNAADYKNINEHKHDEKTGWSKIWGLIKDQIYHKPWCFPPKLWFSSPLIQSTPPETMA